MKTFRSKISKVYQLNNHRQLILVLLVCALLGAALGQAPGIKSALRLAAVAAQGNQKAQPVAQNNNSRSDLPPKTKRAKTPTTPRIPAVAPANDNCASAIAINSCPFTNTQVTTDATDEVGEPGSTCTLQGKSVWYTYTAPAFGAQVTVSTCTSDFDTAIMVWRVTGGPCDFASFVPVVCNDDFCGDGFQSFVSFLADPGQTYKIQVGGFDSETGTLVTNVDCTILTCPSTVIHGTLGSNDPTFPGPRASGNQIGRLNRNGIASSCAAPKTCLIFDPANARAFDAYTFTNSTGAAACVSVFLNGTAGDNNLQSNAYLGSYDPNNICTNYLADPGLSLGVPPAPTNFSFNVPAGASFVVVVHTTNPGETAGMYDLSVVGNICQTCTINCPASITVPNDPNQCGAVVTYPAPTTGGSGNCGTVNCSPASGSFFPVGTTTVTCSATGASMPSCTFTVTVNDTQPPVITCPANQAAQLPPSQTTVAVNYPPPTASDNCPGVTVNCVPPSGSSFPLGVATVNCTATDAASNTASCSFTVTVTCPTLPPTLPNGQAGVPYNQSVAGTPAGTYVYSVIQGNLPSGLTLNPNTGAITGTATVTGTYSFKVRGQTANGCNPMQTYTLVIACPTITLAPATLPNGTTGTSYSQSVVASPAGGNYTYAVSSGSLPAGLNLNPATGLLSGTPTANGSFNFTVTATGFGSCTGSQAYTIVIGGGGCPTITLSSLPNGNVGQLYSNAVTASPAGSYSYAVTAGSLPPGLTLFGAFGLVYGFPTAAGSYTFTITATDSNNCTGSQSYTVVIGGAPLARAGDFDGDGKADTAVFRASQANWLVVQSSNNSLQTLAWGAAGDQQAAGDYDGDGKVDMAVFTTTGHWRVKRSSDGAVVDKLWGLATDVPVPGDYDGDGKTDIAVWRGSEGNWYIVNSSDGAIQVVMWGLATAPYGDVAVPGDYDGDKKTDLAVFRKQDGTWYIKRSSDGTIKTQAWGLGTDTPVPGDYDGDGKTDIAVWRGQSSTWFIIRSGSGLLQMATWGASYAPYNDVPVPGDYDGDGKTDIAVWRPAQGMWYSLNSSDGQARIRQHGQAGDTPVTGRP